MKNKDLDNLKNLSTELAAISDQYKALTNIKELTDILSKVKIISNQEMQKKTVDDLSENINDIWSDHCQMISDNLKKIDVNGLKINYSNINDMREKLIIIENYIKELEKMKFILNQDFEVDEITNLDNDVLFKQQQNKSTIENYILKLNNIKLIIAMKQLEIKLKDTNIKIEETNKNNAQMNKKYMKIMKNISSTSRKLDGILTNVFALIITFSFVAAIVSAIDHIKSQFIPLLLMTGVWISVTLIAFNAGIYKIDTNDKTNNSSKKRYLIQLADDPNTRQSIALYLVITIMEIIVMICTLYYI